jgi:ankyrin repeat protein
MSKEDLPLNIALENRYYKIAQILIDYGANVNQENCYLETPLFVAVTSGNLNSVQLLLNNHANPNLSEFDTCHFNMLPMGHAKTEEIAQLLYDHGAEVLNKCDDAGMTYLHYASAQGNVKLVQFLLKIWIENEREFDVIDANFETPLSHAVTSGFENTAKILLQFGSDANFLSDGFTLLQYAIMRKQKNILKELIAHDALTSLRNLFGQNTLDVVQTEQELGVKKTYYDTN